jgi:hypothetical protein
MNVLLDAGQGAIIARANTAQLAQYGPWEGCATDSLVADSVFWDDDQFSSTPYTAFFDS